MANIITENCVNCGACEPVCPSEGISRGDETFVINPEQCTECVGFYHIQQCARVCPVECCVIDPNTVETELELFERARKLHPEIADTLQLGPETSHFQREKRSLGTSLQHLSRRVGGALRQLI